MTTTMRAVAGVSVPVARRTNGVHSDAPTSRMTYSRSIGALFLAGFLVYGGGAALVTSVTGAPDFLSTISAHQTTLVIGACLIGLPLWLFTRGFQPAVYGAAHDGSS